METAILNRVNEKFAGTFNDFDTKEHCSHSDYFVDQVKWAIGEVAFRVNEDYASLFNRI